MLRRKLAGHVMSAALTLAAISAVMPAVPARAQERGPTGSVTLTRPDYDRLLDLAARQPRPPDAAPLAAALTRADIRARISPASVRATMTIEGEVFQAGTVKVPVIADATLLDARAADRPFPLVAEGNRHVALVSGPGPFAATLEWGSIVTVSPGVGSFVLPVPPAGSATAIFDVPGEQSDLSITPGLVLRRTSANGRTLVEAALDPGMPTRVWWSSRESGPVVPARDVRLLSDVKTLVTIGAADVRLLSLVDVTVVQGVPAQVDVRIPAGYELAGATGSSLDRSEQKGDLVSLTISGQARRRHQFLLNLERANAGGSFTLQTSFPTVPAAQREAGEVAVEGLGTLEVSSPEVPGLRRMDVREVDPVIVAAARQGLLSAYRYQRSTTVPVLALNVVRFPDAAVLAAVAERAVATTLLTTEGRALTEVSLWLRNRAQPFMRVSLPPGATMLSVDVAGAPAKPAEGADGMRVPLLRPGFRPDGPYTVSFVYLHSGPAFAKRGDMQMTLPRMDIPVTLVEWELFVPDQYRADRFAGTAMAAHLIEPVELMAVSMPVAVAGDVSIDVKAGQIAGRVMDHTGGVIPGVTVIVSAAGARRTAVTNGKGEYAVGDLPSGPVSITAGLEGFVSAQQSIVFDQQPRRLDFQLAVGGLSETVNVTAETPVINTQSAMIDMANSRSREDSMRRAGEQRAQAQGTAASVNVQSLQRRASGVLPVRIDVPREGLSHQFVKPLVIDEETVVSFRYRRR